MFLINHILLLWITVIEQNVSCFILACLFENNAWHLLVWVYRGNLCNVSVKSLYRIFTEMSLIFFTIVHSANDLRSKVFCIHLLQNALNSFQGVTFKKFRDSVMIDRGREGRIDWWMVRWIDWWMVWWIDWWMVRWMDGGREKGRKDYCAKKYPWFVSISTACSFISFLVAAYVNL